MFSIGKRLATIDKKLGDALVYRINSQRQEPMPDETELVARELPSLSIITLLAVLATAAISGKVLNEVYDSKTIGPGIEITACAMPNAETGGDRALDREKKKAESFGMENTPVTSALDGVDRYTLGTEIANTIHDATGHSSKELPGKMVVSFVLETDGDITNFKFIGPTDPNYGYAVASSCPPK